MKSETFEWLIRKIADLEMAMTAVIDALEESGTYVNNYADEEQQAAIKKIREG